MIEKHKRIPEGYIEDADNYCIIPLDTQKTIELGGRIMMKLVVMERMTVDNIVATSGLDKTVCCIIVSYTAADVSRMIREVKKYIGKIIDQGGDLYGGN